MRSKGKKAKQAVAVQPHSKEVVAPKVNFQPTQEDRPQGEEAVRQRAYELWEAAGRPRSDGVDFWLNAEKELRKPSR